MIAVFIVTILDGLKVNLDISLSPYLSNLKGFFKQRKLL